MAFQNTIDRIRSTPSQPISNINGILNRYCGQTLVGARSAGGAAHRARARLRDLVGAVDDLEARVRRRKIAMPAIDGDGGTLAVVFSCEFEFNQGLNLGFCISIWLDCLVDSLALCLSLTHTHTHSAHIYIYISHTHTAARISAVSGPIRTNDGVLKSHRPHDSS